MGYSPQGHKESDTTEILNIHTEAVSLFPLSGQRQLREFLRKLTPLTNSKRPAGGLVWWQCPRGLADANFLSF